VCADGFGERAGVEDTGHTKRAPEGTATLRKREASRISVHMCAATRPSACRIRQNTEMISVVHDRDDPQQLGGYRAFPAPHTGADRQRATHH
jgi:hypothetical protein